LNSGEVLTSNVEDNPDLSLKRGKSNDHSERK